MEVVGVKRIEDRRTSEKVSFYIGEREENPLYIDMETIKAAWTLVGIICGIVGMLFAAYKWYLKQNSLKGEIDKLRHEHVEDIKRIEEEACLHTYGILACLKGLQEKGCNGPVTEAIEKYEKYLNKRAHDQEG